MYEDIADTLDEFGIPNAAPISELGEDPSAYFDETDHLTDAGNVRLARFMRRFVDEHPPFPPRGQEGRGARRAWSIPRAFAAVGIPAAERLGG